MTAKQPPENDNVETRTRGCRRSSWRRPTALALTTLVALLLTWRVLATVQRTRNGVATVSEPAGKIHGATSLRHAKRFTIEYRADSKIVRVAESKDPKSGTTTYQLIPRGVRPSRVEDGAFLVEIPVRRAIALSTVNAPSFVKLGVPEALVGMAGVKLLSTEALIAQAKAGRLVEISDGGAGMDKRLDLERIRELKPDLIVTSYLGDESSKLREAGLRVVENSEWLESTPLGRAEWIKFIAAFLDLETEAERAFVDIERRYAEQAARALGVSKKPTVLCGMDHRGTWYVPGGQSYLAALIRDAGGNYLWQTTPGAASLPLKMEAVLHQAREAEVWLLHMSAVGSRTEMSELDPRYSLFSAYRSGMIYNSDARISAGGGNDYWENGVANPDLLLADLIAILHPELARNHRLIWYRQLPEAAGQ